MDEIPRGLARAVNLICTADPAVLEIIWLSLLVTGLALAISTLIGVPAGAALGLWSRIRVRGLVTVLLYTGMGLPPVVVGLAVYLLLSRSGPLGGAGLAVHAQCHGARPDRHRPARRRGPDHDGRAKRRAGVAASSACAWAPPAGRNWLRYCSRRGSA